MRLAVSDTARCVAGLTVGIAVAVVLAWSLLREPAIARPVAVPVVKMGERPASRGASEADASSAARDAGLAPTVTCRVFVYEKLEPSPHRFEAALSLQLLASASHQTLAECRSRAVAASRDAHIVLDLEGRRISVTRSELLGCSDADLRAMLEATDDAVTFRVEDAAVRQLLPALLVGSGGRPFGPIEGGLQALVLGAGFDGQALAPGFLPASFERTGSHAFASLYRAAWVTGRLAGAPFTRGTLSFRSVEDPRAPFALDVEVDAGGAFAVGPIPAGRKQLRLDADRAWLVKSARQVDLRPGPQDLGVLQLDPLFALHLRVLQDDRDYSGDLFVSLALRDRKLDSFPVQVFPIDKGRLVIERFRADRAAIVAWTQDGYLADGPSDGALAELTSAANPLTLVLRAPGAVVVQASTAPFELPDGSALLAYATTYHRERHALLRCAEDRPDERVRRFVVPPGGNVLIDRLWPGAIGLALVSPHGAVLASGVVEVIPATTVAMTLRPEVALAALDVSGPVTGQRFALTAETTGVVARARATAQVTRILIAPGRYHVQTLSDSSVGERRMIEVAAGEVRALTIE